MQTLNKKVGAGGRPPKFAEPSRPITLTLPERTLHLLKSIDQDRALAVSRAVDWITRAQQVQSEPVEIVEVETGTAIILVGPSQYLRRIPWLRLVEIAPARFLLVVPSGTAVASVEVALNDLLDTLGVGDVYERDLLTRLRDIINSQRRTERVSKAELLLIDVD